MISNSVPAMTAIDLLIVAVAGYGIWRSRLVLPGTRFARTRIGLLLINFGLLAVALFYLADLATMHVLPIITSKDEAMQAMEYLHGDLSWLIILLMTISISIGFIELLVELQRREAKARQQEMELAHANRVSALGHMSATIVHEMTQPIAAARMNALAALSFRDRQPPELGRTREALGSIVGNADRGREIIGRIRAFG